MKVASYSPEAAPSWWGKLRRWQGKEDAEYKLCLEPQTSP